MDKSLLIRFAKFLRSRDTLRRGVEKWQWHQALKGFFVFIDSLDILQFYHMNNFSIIVIHLCYSAEIVLCLLMCSGV